MSAGVVVNRRPLPGWVGPALGGLGLGVVNALSSGLGSPYGPVALAPMQGIRALECLAAWLGTAWAWAMFAFAVGWFSFKIGAAVAGAIGGLLVAVVAYYVMNAVLRLTDSLSTLQIVYWSLIALVVGPLMGAAGWAGRRTNWWGVLAALTAPTLMLVDTAARPTGPDTIRPWAQWVVYAVAVILGVGLVLRAAVLGRRRVGPARG